MGTHYLGEECEVLARDTYVKLMRCVATVGSFGQRSLARAGLTPRQFGVLKALCHLGLIHQKAIGRTLLLSEGSITSMVCNLEWRGPASRTRANDVRRFVALALNREGYAPIKVPPGLYCCRPHGGTGPGGAGDLRGLLPQAGQEPRGRRVERLLVLLRGLAAEVLGEEHQLE